MLRYSGLLKWFVCSIELKAIQGSEKLWLKYIRATEMSAEFRDLPPGKLFRSIGMIFRYESLMSVCSWSRVRASCKRSSWTVFPRASRVGIDSERLSLPFPLALSKPRIEPDFQLFSPLIRRIRHSHSHEFLHWLPWTWAYIFLPVHGPLELKLKFEVINLSQPLYQRVTKYQIEYIFFVFFILWSLYL